jgi:hypothetical protein
MKCLGLHNKPTAEVNPGHMLTGLKKKKKKKKKTTTKKKKSLTQN